MKTFANTVIGVMAGVALTGLALYAAGNSTNPTIKNLAQHITAGFGA